MSGCGIIAAGPALRFNMNEQPTHFYQLDPNTILDALESIDVIAEAALLPLNSYENRVYQFRDRDNTKFVVKFYRPSRWSDQQILEEHHFSEQMVDAEIPVVPPMKINQSTLHHFNDFRFSVFENHGGRHPDLDNEKTLTWLGRFIARIHNVGEIENFKTRWTITPKSYAIDSYQFLTEHEFIPRELKESMDSVCRPLIDECVKRFDRFSDITQLRIHGDCHPSNVMWTDDGPHFVDLDDSRTGPAVQDLWMLITGDDDEKINQRNAILDGYEEFREFDDRELQLIEPLRAMRMMHYMGWLANRWDDPSFKHNFPWFNTTRYWEEQLLNLKEQLGTLQNEVTPGNWL
ncbi:Ser/Thr protein kinase RdoA (MazF antagonist) [Pleionea mediterranea]|uniref:Stress response kinase A n=2 Tax=Pleionea mediterranea TaxID=523701 RepID=A0A316FSV0_9GAMM|nr:Ser/Thr protein kinase RdoA (MazF antagonist) [Pleionea mediterranea]